MDGLSGFDGKDTVGDMVQEGPVVGCDHHSPGERGKVFLEPQVSLKVEVVGGLVQEKEVRLSEEQPGQFGPHDPAAAELAHGAGEVAFLEAQT